MTGTEKLSVEFEQVGVHASPPAVVMTEDGRRTYGLAHRDARTKMAPAIGHVCEAT